MRQSRIATLLHGKDTINNVNYANFIYERAKATANKIYQQRGWVDASVIGIDFGAMDVGASQQAACGVEVAASGEGHRGEGVTQAVLSRQLQYDWYLHFLHSKKPMGQDVAGANYITCHKAQPYNYNCQQE